MYPCSKLNLKIPKNLPQTLEKLLKMCWKRKPEERLDFADTYPKVAALKVALHL